jgi:hypothetical protein
MGGSSLVQKIAQQCEYLLVEAADMKFDTATWSVTGRSGRQYQARLVVDEWTDSPIVELSNDSGDVVQTFGIRLSCWPLR